MNNTHTHARTHARTHPHTLLPYTIGSIYHSIADDVVFLLIKTVTPKDDHKLCDNGGTGLCITSEKCTRGNGGTWLCITSEKCKRDNGGTGLCIVRNVHVIMEV